MNFQKVLLGALLLTGCSTFQNTPAQERTWAAYEACKAEGRVVHVQVTWVERDGRYWYEYLGSPYGAGELKECMNEQFAKMRAKRT